MFGRGGSQGGRGGFVSRGRGGGGFGGGRGRGGFGGGRGGGFGGRGGGRGGGFGGRGGGRGFGGRGRGGGRGFGGGRGGRGRGRGRGGPVIINPMRFQGIFKMSKMGKETLLTQSMVQGESVYGEKRVSADRGEQKIEYRAWNPYRSKIAAGIQVGVEAVKFGPGSKVLYLGASTGTTCSHVADIIGEKGVLYAVEFSPRCGRELLNMAKKRTNIVPLILDARKPWDYRYLMEMVDFVFADVAQPDQARIMGINCKHFLRDGGNFMIAIKSSCVDSTLDPEVVFAQQIDMLKGEGLTVDSYVSLEPYQKDHALVIGSYRA